MHIGAPQLIYLAIMVIGWGYELAMHGKTHTTKHNFPAKIIASAILMALLYWGGFFTNGC